MHRSLPNFPEILLWQCCFIWYIEHGYWVIFSSRKNDQVYLRVQKFGNFGGTPLIFFKSCFLFSFETILIAATIAENHIFLLIYKTW